MLTAVGCGGDDPPTSHEHDDVFRVGVAFGVDEIAVGGHVPINAGQNNRTTFNLYNEHNDRMTVVDHYQLTVTFNPTTLATATPVTGTTNVFDITSSAAAETNGTMSVSVYHPHTQTTKNFGPFDVLIH